VSGGHGPHGGGSKDMELIEILVLVNLAAVLIGAAVWALGWAVGKALGALQWAFLKAWYGRHQAGKGHQA
jgi:hypothetical protein